MDKTTETQMSAKRDSIRITVDRIEGDTVVCSDSAGNILEFSRELLPDVRDGDMLDYNPADGSFLPLERETAAAAEGAKRRLNRLFARGGK